MSSANFPHHSGGVVQVAHAGRWGAVPEALLEDQRLSLDARAVAAWLAIKANGWQISIWALRRATGEHDKPLSTHKWGRIAKELEAAGYFARSRSQGSNGQWVWHVTFWPIPPMSEKTEYGSPEAGKTNRGKTTDKPILPTPLPSIPLPLQPDGGGSAELIYPRLSGPERSALEGLLTGCPTEHHQPILDELAGSQQKNRLRVGVIPFARALVQAAAEGRFTPSLGLTVAAARQASTKSAAAPAPFVADAAAQAVGARLLARVRGGERQHG